MLNLAEREAIDRLKIRLDELAKQAKETKENAYSEAAKQLHLMYDAFVKEGFSPCQSFELIKMSLDVNLKIAAGAKK